MNIQKTILVTIGVIVIAVGAWYFISSNWSFDEESSGERSFEREDAVAVVNGEEISRTDFEDLKSQIAMQQDLDISSLDAESNIQFEAQVVDELIVQTLIKQETDKLGITVSQEKVTAQIENIIAQLGGEEAYQAALVEEGFSEEELREEIRADLTVQAYFEEELDLPSITVSEEEVETRYAEEAAQSENIPSLEDVRSQVEGMIIQEKQQELITQLIQELRAAADIEVFI